MNDLSSASVRRYRMTFGLRLACVPVAFLGAALPALLPHPPPDWLVLIPAAWFFGFLTLGLLGTWSLERRLLEEVDPDAETRRRVISLSWFRPVGSFMAVNELLRLAEEK